MSLRPASVILPEPLPNRLPKRYQSSAKFTRADTVINESGNKKQQTFEVEPDLAVSPLSTSNIKVKKRMASEKVQTATQTPILSK